MPINTLTRQYAQAWLLVETVLKEAIREPERSAARRRLQLHVSPSAVLSTSAPLVLKGWKEKLQALTSSLTPLDAYAAVHGSESDRKLLTGLIIAPWLDGCGIRFLQWCEAWKRCQTDQDYGKQALVTLRLLRDIPSVGKAIGGHLSAVAQLLAKQGKSEQAYRLRIGSLLCTHDPDPAEIQAAGRSLTPKVATGSQEHLQAQSASQAIAQTPSYEIYINRLSALHKGDCKGHVVKPFYDLETLEKYVATNIHLMLKDTQVPQKISKANQFHVAIDWVIGEGEKRQPRVTSYLRDKPHLITSTNKKGREWYQDLDEFLTRDMQDDPMTVGELADSHLKNGRETLANNLNPHKQEATALASRIIKHLGQQLWTGEKLFSYLKEVMPEVQALRYGSKSGPYRSVGNWCRAVNRNVLNVEGRRENIWLVNQPRKSEANCDSPLKFNTNYYYIAISRTQL